MSRRMALVSALPESAEEAVRSGWVPPHAAMKSLVPLARANSAGQRSKRCVPGGPDQARDPS